MSRRPKGRSAVMAEHAPAEVVADTPLRALQRKLEYFPTPPWATRAGAELVKALDPDAQWAWDPCCGQGHMAYALGDHFARVLATDIHAHGPSPGGWDGRHGEPVDFLSPAADAYDEADWVFANPPFSLAAEFVAAGLRRARRGVAILCRLAWWDTHGRYSLFFDPARGCDVKAAFFERVAMQLGEWDPEGGTATAYAWFLFFQPEARPAWLDQAQVLIRAGAPPGIGSGPIDFGFGPGTKARLTRPMDARLFGRRGATPLFGEE
jgi:hypothetical protein